MESFVYGLIAGIGATAILSFTYHTRIVSQYEKAASGAGVLFAKVEGKITAIRKAL